MSYRSAIFAAAVTATALASTADAQNFWVPRANGLAYAGNIGAGHNNNPMFNLDIRSHDNRAAFIQSSAQSGRSIAVLSTNLSARGTAVRGDARSRYGTNAGVVGTSLSRRGTGVKGVARRGTGVHAKTQTGTALVAQAKGNTPGAYAGMFLGGETFFEQNTGFGVVDPAVPVHISGDARISDNGRLWFGDAMENTDDIYIQRKSYGYDSSGLLLNLGDNPNNSGTDWIEVRAGGQAKFWFGSNGEAYKTSGSNWTIYSDRRLKHDITGLEDSLDRLLGLRGVSFYYNDPDAVGAAEGLQTGFVAQEVEEVFPDWVGEQADGTKTLTIKGFEALTVESIRELRDEKDAQIAELTEQLAALEAVLAEMNSKN